MARQMPNPKAERKAKSGRISIDKCQHNWQQWGSTDYWLCSICGMRLKRSADLWPYSPEWMARDVESQVSEAAALSGGVNGRMRGLYGEGPGEATCGGCANLYRLHHNDQVYLKCHLRGSTHGAGTDMRAKWPACGKFVAREGKIGEVHQ